MISNIKGRFYDTVILQVMIPEIADVSTDYNAKKFSKNGSVSTKVEDTRPFIVCHPVALQMKVQTWLGKDITLSFQAGKDATPLRKIFANPAPVVVENGEATATAVTSVQIGY